MSRSLLALAVLVLVGAAGVSAGGGQPAPVAALVARGAPDFGLEIWQGTAGGACRRSAVLRGAEPGALSPDGRVVAYGQPAGRSLELRVVPAGGGQARLLARIATDVTALAWSPDGRFLAFTSPAGLELVNVAGAARRRPVPLPAAWRGSGLERLAVSPDGKRIAFSRTFGEGQLEQENELAVIGLDGRGARALYVNDDPYGAQPAPVWSPDGKRIAFLVHERELFTVPAAGGRPARLTPPAARAVDGEALWSPDGSLLAFPRQPVGRGAYLHVIGADGTGLRRLAPASSVFAWSPDGAQLLGVVRGELATLDAESATATRLCAGGRDYQSARWVS